MSLNDSINKVSKEHNSKMRKASATFPLHHPTIIVFVGDAIAGQIEFIKSEITSRWQNGENILFFHFYCDTQIDDPDICSVNVSKFVEGKNSSREARESLLADSDFLKKLNATVSEKVSHMFDIRYMSSQQAYCTVVANVDDPCGYLSGELVAILRSHVLLAGVANMLTNAIHLFTENHGNMSAPAVRREMLNLYSEWKKGIQADLFHDGFDEPLKPVSIREVFDKIYFLDERDSDLFNYSKTTHRSTVIADIIYSHLFSYDFPGYFKTVGLLEEEVTMDYLLLGTIFELNETASGKMEQLLSVEPQNGDILVKIQSYIESACDKNYSMVRQNLFGNLIRLPFKPGNISGIDIDTAEEMVFGCAISAKFDYLVSKMDESTTIPREILDEIEKINTSDILESILEYSKHIVSVSLKESASETGERQYVESSNASSNMAFGDSLEQEIIEKKYDFKISDMKRINKTNLYKIIIDKCENCLEIIKGYQTSFAEFRLMVKQQKILLENSWAHSRIDHIRGEIQSLVWNSEANILDYLVMAAQAQASGDYDKLVYYAYNKFAVEIMSTKTEDNTSLIDIPVFCRLRCPVPDEFSEVVIDTGVTSKKRLKSVNLQKEDIVFFERILE